MRRLVGTILAVVLAAPASSAGKAAGDVLMWAVRYDTSRAEENMMGFHRAVAAYVEQKGGKE